MTVFQRLVKPVRQAAAAFFQHDLAVRREDGSVRVVLQPRRANGAGTAGAALQTAGARSRAAIQQERREREQLDLILSQLADLLNSPPDTRATVRHLAFVEQTLSATGLSALHTLPLDVLQMALEQIENLVINWSPTGLANLRSKMAVAVAERGNNGADGQANASGQAESSVAQLDQDVVAAGLRHADPAQKPVAHAEADDAALAAAYAGYATFPTTVPAASELADGGELCLVSPVDLLPTPPVTAPDICHRPKEGVPQAQPKTGNSLHFDLLETRG